MTYKISLKQRKEYAKKDLGFNKKEVKIYMLGYNDGTFNPRKKCKK